MSSTPTPDFWCSVCRNPFKSHRAFTVHTSLQKQMEGDQGPCFEANCLTFAEYISSCKADGHGGDDSMSSGTGAKPCSIREADFHEQMKNLADSQEITSFLLEARATKRYFNNVPLRHLEMEREDTKRLMQMVSDELRRNLSPGMSHDQMAECVMKACDVFCGMETTYKEDRMRKLDLDKHGLTPVQPVRRVLIDEQTGKPTNDVCYDLPIDQTLEYMLQSRPDVWDNVRHANVEWMQKSCEEAGKERSTLKDLTDGIVLRSHPMLGDVAAITARDTGDCSPRLKMILYYDEVETVNAIGAFTGKHKIGLFYYVLVSFQSCGDRVREGGSVGRDGVDMEGGGASAEEYTFARLGGHPPPLAHGTA